MSIPDQADFHVAGESWRRNMCTNDAVFELMRIRRGPFGDFLAKPGEAKNVAELAEICSLMDNALEGQQETLRKAAAILSRLRTVDRARIFKSIIKAHSVADAETYFQNHHCDYAGSYEVDFTWEGKTYKVKVWPTMTVRRLKEDTVQIIRKSFSVNQRTKDRLFQETIRLALHGVVISGNKDGEFTTLREIEGFDKDAVVGAIFSRNSWAVGRQDNAPHELLNGDGKVVVYMRKRQRGTLRNVYKDDRMVDIVSRIATEMADVSPWRRSYWTGLSSGGDGIQYGSCIFDFNENTLGKRGWFR